MSTSSEATIYTEEVYTTPKMSITQTHILARKARSKLAREASKSNHEMRYALPPPQLKKKTVAYENRRLVGHANLLDVLIKHIYEAETEQESWFEETIQAAEELDAKYAAESIGWLPVDETLYDSSSSEEESDSEDDYDEDDYDDEPEYIYNLSRTPSNKAQVLRFETAVGVKEIHLESTSDADTESDSADSEEDDEGLFPLRRSSSSSLHTPPALVDDSTDDEEDDHSNPPSPKQTMMGPEELTWLKTSTRKSAQIPRFFSTAAQSTPSLSEHEVLETPGMYAAMIDSF